MNTLALLPLSEQKDVALLQYIQYLEYELERTQAALQRKGAHKQEDLGVTTIPMKNDASSTPLACSEQLQQKDFYEAVVEEQLDLICRLGSDFRLTFVNRPYANLYGKQTEELLGQSILDGVPPEYRSQVVAHLTALNPEQPVAVDENPVYASDGSWHWFHWTNRLVTHPTGLIEYQAVGRDITDRKQAEAAEREQRQLAEAMRDSLAALTSSLDVDQVMTQILLSAATVVPSDAGTIILIEGNDGRVVYCRGFAPELIPTLKQQRFAVDTWANIHNAVVHRAPYVVLDTHAAEEWVGWPLTSWIRSSIGVPIELNGQVIGLLIADSAIPHYFKQPDVEKLQAFARYASLALANAHHATMLERCVRERTAELQTSEQKFRQLVHTAPVAIVLSDQTGHITFINHRAELLFGYRPDELIQQPVEILLSEACREIYVSDVATYVSNILPQGTRDMGEVVACRKDGSPFPAEIELSYIETANGFLIMSFFINITERKQAAAAIRKQRDFLQTVIDKIPGAITVVDQDGRFQLTNQYLAQLLWATPPAMIGKLYTTIMANSAETDHVERMVTQVLTSKQTLCVPEILFQGRWYQVSMIPMADFIEEADQVLIVSFDITERKQAELVLQQALVNERELNQLRSGFITNVSHEFRTPLAIILSTTETLSTYRKKLTDEQIELRLVRISTQVQHLTVMLRDLLDLTKIQSHYDTVKPSLCNPATLVRDIILGFQSQMEVRHQLLYTFEEHFPMINLDEQLFQRILSNLLDNAVKYSAMDKAVLIHLAYASNMLVLTVRDEGIGIPSTDIKHLFQPFYRGTNVGPINGTGLGLSITKEAVERLGGSLAIESQLGIGTTFTVNIPTL